VDRATIRAKNRLFDDKSRYLDRFGLVLAFTVLAIICLALIDLEPEHPGIGTRIVSGATTVLVASALLVALRASGLAKRWQRLADAIIAVGIVSLVVLLILAEVAHEKLPDRLTTGAPALIVLLAILTPLSVIRRLLQHRTITVSTLVGALSVYLLIPVAYYYMYVALNRDTGHNFFATPQPTQAYMYFSLTTVTTTGYGDLTAQTDIDRLFANSEAIIGQLYLVTVVAMIVGLMAANWHPRHSIAEMTEEPEDALSDLAQEQESGSDQPA
jgi:voltage-gated potassium channel Kch